MTRPPSWETLRPRESEQLRYLVEQVVLSWQHVEGADLKGLLRRVSPSLQVFFLHELIKTDLEMRYQHRKPAVLEDYLYQFSELGHPENLPVSLIWEEYRVRRRHGTAPTLASYRERFPAQYADLVHLVESET